MVAPVTKLNLLTRLGAESEIDSHTSQVVALDGGAVHPHFEAERLPAVSRPGEGSDGGAGQAVFL
jgi:hypothetical protein